MNAAEIAEALHNGDIAQARYGILYDSDTDGTFEYDAATMALDVVSELAMLAPDYPDYQWALGKVRRCLEGAS